MDTWTIQDSTLALAQGWGVYEIWDGRLYYEVQKANASDIFTSDEAAREYVRQRGSATSNRDYLCHKACVIVFHSKLGVVPETKGKK